MNCPNIYKVTGQSILAPTKEFFNTQIGRLRVKSEHCIGILKNRFPAVRRNNIRVRGKGDIKRLLQLVDCADILHNILLDVGDEVPDEYLQDIDSGHYWMSEDDGEEDSNTNKGIEYDRRNAAFDTILENSGYGLVR